MKTKTCGCCGDKWEEMFLCPECSGKYLGEREVELPVIPWDGCGPETEPG